jgi:hypothetical protein
LIGRSIPTKPSGAVGMTPLLVNGKERWFGNDPATPREHKFP